VSLLVGFTEKLSKIIPLHKYVCIVSFLQLNVSTTATLGTDEKGHCREVALVERLKQEWMYGLSAPRPTPKKMAVEEM